jgi:hypothetical protein
VEHGSTAISPRLTEAQPGELESLVEYLRKSPASGGLCNRPLRQRGHGEGPTLTTSTEHPDGSLLVERRKICDGWSRVANEWILIKEAGARRFYFELTILLGSRA